MDISALPAVVDASSPSGVFATAVGRETGLNGATPAGCFRAILVITISLAVGLVSAAICFVLAVLTYLFLLETPEFASVVGNVVGLVAVLAFPLGIWGSYTILNLLMHPNVAKAQEVLKTGNVPLDAIGPALQAREPITAEQKRFDAATRKLQSQDALFFDGWFVLHSSYPYALTFGSYLFLSRGAIESNNLDKIIAHELGHLNNGDSFVKCALWVLSKGWFREHMTLAGMTANAAGDKEAQLAGMEKIGNALLKQSWETALAQATFMSIVATGSSLIGMEEDLRVYFWQWDIDADVVAETMVDSSRYNAYLKELAAFEKAMAALPLSAPPELRHDRSLVRLADA